MGVNLRALVRLLVCLEGSMNDGMDCHFGRFYVFLV